MADPVYTVLVRVPIPRGDFVDPPPVHWDSAKDDALWKILSGAGQDDIDWNQVSERFGVPVDFLLQQVAYLTERHASQVRAQVRKATAAAKGSSAPSPVPGSENQRTASALSMRRDSPMPRNDGSSASATPLAGSGRPVISRNTSANTNTAVLRDASGSSPGRRTSVAQRSRQGLGSAFHPCPSGRHQLPSHLSPRRRPEPTKTGPCPRALLSPTQQHPPTRTSRVQRSPASSVDRPGFQQQDATEAYQDEDEDGSEPAFQPYQAQSGQASAQDLTSTLKGDGHPAPKRRPKAVGRDATQQSQTSDSSVGSAHIQRPGKTREPKGAGPLSPRRTAELAGRSPGGKAKASSREGSDGTPSMGSSFSDLDDASVTQSALEDAIASQMNRGAISSRFSISGAFRSRYNPGSNQ
ncbi:hypothetical protein ACCO45_002088 [Purpureocillium lilacinum]|uniref:Uncharacterized protein n=1 Tax=Purpureocillium lilacinum TaxID=33203 RepID=A0ACC4EBA6_PURLI